jgi:putative transcriptional regulator
MRSTPQTPPPSPSHHVPEEGLLEYVAGAATDPAALAIACHVSLCAACGAMAAALEAVGGTILETSVGQDLAPGALEAVLARLDATPQAKTDAATLAPPPFLAAFGLPPPLLRRLPPVTDWHFVVPGVRAIDLPADATPDAGAANAPAAKLRLVSFKGGTTIPLHAHDGPEYVVVFSGALEEKADAKRFGRGDISIRLTDEQHEQRATPGEPCIALVVNEGPLRPLTLGGRFLLALAGE